MSDYSLTEAVKLCESALPGWAWTVYSKCGAHGPRAVLVSPESKIQIVEDGETPTLALLKALRSAKEAKYLDEIRSARE